MTLYVAEHLGKWLTTITRVLIDRLLWWKFVRRDEWLRTIRMGVGVSFEWSPIPFAISDLPTRNISFSTFRTGIKEEIAKCSFLSRWGYHCFFTFNPLSHWCIRRSFCQPRPFTTSMSCIIPYSSPQFLSKFKSCFLHHLHKMVPVKWMFHLFFLLLLLSYEFSCEKNKPAL